MMTSVPSAVTGLSFIESITIWNCYYLSGTVLFGAGTVTIFELSGVTLSELLVTFSVVLWTVSSFVL